jgi:hypothetical protein
MKRLILSFGLLAGIVVAMPVQKAAAQTTTTVTAASFTTTVNQLDAYLTAGDTTSAKATFQTLNTMMIQVLGVTKKSVHDATTLTDREYYTNYLSTQQIPAYKAVWALKSDLVTNHAAIISKLNAFDALIY